jgi:hypothetical protein
MTTLLAFPRRGHPWSSLERKVLGQIQRALGNLGLAIKCEHGVTDEGDPWTVFYGSAEGRFVAHVARIDATYLLVLADGTSLRAATLNRLADAVCGGRAHAA